MDKFESISVVVTGLIFEKYQFNMTLAALRDLQFFTYPYKVQLIFVHNKWRLADDLDAHIKPLGFDDYTYIANEDNACLGKMYNQGIAAAKHDTICVLSNDMLVHKDWYKHAAYALDHGLDLVCLYSHRPPREIFETEVAKKTKDGLWVYSFSDGAGAFVMKKDVYNLVGPFNETMRLFMDREYYDRLQEKGVKIGSHIESLVTHLGQMTLLNPTNVTKHKDYFEWDYYESLNRENTELERIRDA